MEEGDSENHIPVQPDPEQQSMGHGFLSGSGVDPFPPSWCAQAIKNNLFEHVEK